MISPLLALTLAVAAAVPPVVQDPDVDLNDRLVNALRDLRTRDPGTAEEVALALERGSREALHFLEEHAEYLAVLESAPPRLRESLLEQERIQERVRGTLGEFDELQQASAEARHLPERAERIHQRLEETGHELRRRLQEWFDVRQRIRSIELDLLEEEVGDLEEHLRFLGQEGGADAAAEAWLDRATTGGRRGMRERLEHWQRHGRWEVLAEPLFHLLAERGAFEEGEWDVHDPEALMPLLEEHPELVEHARAEAGPHYELEARFVELQGFLLEHVEGEVLELGEEAMAAAHERIRGLVELEREVGAFELEHLLEEIEAERRTLEVREQNRDLIVTIKYAELLGYDELYEW